MERSGEWLSDYIAGPNSQSTRSAGNARRLDMPSKSKEPYGANTVLDLEITGKPSRPVAMAERYLSWYLFGA